MFAVIKTGGKQYKVSAGDKIWVEKLDGNPGETLSITDILMLDDGKEKQVGAPFIDNAQVDVKVVKQAREDKIIVFKKKRRQNYRRKQGHRQEKTVLMVEGISLGGKVIDTFSEKSDEKRAPKIEASPIEAPSTDQKSPIKITVSKTKTQENPSKSSEGLKETSSPKKPTSSESKVPTAKKISPSKQDSAVNKAKATTKKSTSKKSSEEIEAPLDKKK